MKVNMKDEDEEGVKMNVFGKENKRARRWFNLV